VFTLKTGPCIVGKALKKHIDQEVYNEEKWESILTFIFKDFGGV
jgi:hypothetical protein